MKRKLTGSDGMAIVIPDGYRGLQGSDGRMVPILTERWRTEYNTLRTHSAFGYKPPAQKLSRFDCPGLQRSYNRRRQVSLLCG